MHVDEVEDRDAEPVIRITYLRARQGQRTSLAQAAQANADDALAAGAVSAEVCVEPDDPDAFLVISRWESRTTLQDFLGWHEQHAHESLADFADGKPRAVHYPVLTSVKKG